MPSRARRRVTAPRPARPDKYALYEEAVQSPGTEIAFIDRVFRRLKGRPPRTLREDFSASALIAQEWVHHHRANFALGIDLDPEPLERARVRCETAMKPEARSRLVLHEGNVLTPPNKPQWARGGGGGGGYDVVAALNFSYWVFHDRATLLWYFRGARQQLCSEGLLVLDFMGGSDCHLESSDRSRRNLKGFGPFTYVWEHAKVEPISGRTVCKIHFEFPGKRKPGGGGRGGPKPRPRFPAMRNAFVYDWRLWHVRELCDVLADAGFARSRVYWEGEEKGGSGNGIFTEQTRGTPDRSYVGYIVAERSTDGPRTTSE